MKTREITDVLLKLKQAVEGIKEPEAAKVMVELLNVIEELASENEKLKEVIQKQRDEINKLKGENGKPDIKPNKKAGNDFSCEKERKEAERCNGNSKKEGFKLDVSSLEKLKEQRIPVDVLENLGNVKGKKYGSKDEFLKGVESVIGAEASGLYGDLLVKYARYKKRERSRKVPEISIDRVEKCKVNRDELPCDAQFKGSKPKVVQDVIIKSDNVRFEREIYWSRSEHKTYIGEVPTGYEGDFGPNINSEIVSLKYVCNMSIPKIKEFYDNIGVRISTKLYYDPAYKKIGCISRGEIGALRSKYRCW